MDLLERETQLEALAGALAEAAGAAGRIVLVHGEAGIGKTSLVEQFAAQQRVTARVLWGTCDSLFTPRPLGPLSDIAHQTQGPLLELLNTQASRTALFSAALDALQDGPAIVVFEDVHWADEATLDLIKFLGRRVQRVKTLLIITFRDDELRADHPVWFALGELPAQVIRRIRLLPLSERAVATLAERRGHSAEGLFELTGGNPFFVTEVLAGEAKRVPATVREATLARAARLVPEARQVLDLVSVVPPRLERWLLEGVLTPSPLLLEACLRTGLIVTQEDSLAFRHELARQAVAAELPLARAQNLHAQVLKAILERGTELAPLARLVHHARMAGDGALVWRFAPQAARQAAALGAHREAAAHYQTALQYAGQMAPDARAELLESGSSECFVTGQVEEAVCQREEALAIWERLGRRDRQGDCLRSLSGLAWFQGDKTASDRYGVEAVRILETIPPGPELAMAYANLAAGYAQAQELAAAIIWGRRSIELAERIGATEALVSSLNTIGMAELLAGDEAGRAKLERSLDLALAHDMQRHVGRAYSNLVESAVCCRDYPNVTKAVDAGVAYAIEHDLLTTGLCMRYWRARMDFEQGRWNDAAEGALAIAGSPHGAKVFRLEATALLGYVRVRRGDPRSAQLLDEAHDLALATGELQRVGSVAAARAEAAWLRGDLEQVRAEVGPALELAYRVDPAPWMLGQLAFWLWRAAALPQAPQNLAAPYALQIAGDWQSAAQAWERIGCPYEQALALADGDQPAHLQALAIFQQLGAAPAADRVRQKMRANGVRSLPRGPRRATRAHPLGLTARERHVAALIAQGKSNRQIAELMVVGVRTVETYVTRILNKLGFDSRVQIATWAIEKGLSAPSQALQD